MLGSKLNYVLPKTVEATLRAEFIIVSKVGY